MGCGKSKLSVATYNGALQKGDSTNAGSKNHREVGFKPFPDEKEKPDELTKTVGREEAEVGENLETEIGGKRDDVNVGALPRSEDATESREMPLLVREEGSGHEAFGQKEEQEIEKKDETLEEEKEATLQGNKDMRPEDEHGDGNEGLVGRLISRDSPDHYFSSRKDDEALEGILSEYNSPLHVDANKPTQEVPIDGELKAKEEPATTVVATQEVPIDREIKAKEEPAATVVAAQEVPIGGELKAKEEPAVTVIPTQENGDLKAKEETAATVFAEPITSSLEPKVLPADGDQTNPSSSA